MTAKTFGCSLALTVSSIRHGLRLRAAGNAACCQEGPDTLEVNPICFHLRAVWCYSCDARQTAGPVQYGEPRGEFLEGASCPRWPRYSTASSSSRQEGRHCDTYRVRYRSGRARNGKFGVVVELLLVQYNVKLGLSAKEGACSILEPYKQTPRNAVSFQWAQTNTYCVESGLGIMGVPLYFVSAVQLRRLKMVHPRSEWLSDCVECACFINPSKFKQDPNQAGESGHVCRLPSPKFYSSAYVIVNSEMKCFSFFFSFPSRMSSLGRTTLTLAAWVWTVACVST